VPLGGRARYSTDRAGRYERQQAAVACETVLVATLAVPHPQPRADQQVAQPVGLGHVRQVTGPPGHYVVQQDRVVIARPIGEGWLDDALDLNVVGVPSELLPQAQQQRSGEAGYGEVIADGD